MSGKLFPFALLLLVDVSLAGMFFKNIVHENFTFYNVYFDMYINTCLKYVLTKVMGKSDFIWSNEFELDKSISMM